MCDDAKLFRPLLNNDMNKTARGFFGFGDDECLSPADKQELEETYSDLSKANEHYLATHKQALGLVSFILHNVIKDQPIEPKKYIRELLEKKELKYLLNKHMVQKGYAKTSDQARHDRQMEPKVQKVNRRIAAEERGKIGKYLDMGKITLTPFGPGYPPFKIEFKKSEISTVLHGLIPMYDKPQKFIQPYDEPQKDPTGWPTFKN